MLIFFVDFDLSLLNLGDPLLNFCAKFGNTIITIYYRIMTAHYLTAWSRAPYHVTHISGISVMICLFAIQLL